ncbi:50S ribosomal protein L33 [Dichelobacter nodosus]|nr:50S ribosomal protein L33 [Dichelobacter nodosus]AXM46102.1 peroxiredoxin [Dichelobacter nodosus]KNZ39789.1 50S ribosomal protein L33 [Dichelobacter nodosus]TGA65818.1 peroxiredoxin [Dichelobacter nodosus]
MAEKLVIIILNSSPDQSSELVEPIYHATIAASMEYQVEVIFAGRAGELAIRGIANKIHSQRKADETIYDLIKEAYQSGVVFKASKFVVQKWGDNVIAEVSEVVSGGYIIGEIMNHNVTTLTY